MPNREEVIEKLKQQLDYTNQKLDELEVKAQQVSGEARKKYEEQIGHLREMSQPARDKLEAMKAAGESQWDSMSAEADKVYKALVHSFNYFKSQVK
jgi:vacuolar-type H+-ATPase subunit H